jgi:hypothetical protein
MMLQLKGEIIPKMIHITMPLQGDYFHIIPVPSQMLNQHTIINVAPGEPVQAAVDYQADAHSASIAAHF